jgi:hypothetical protein
MWCFKNYLQILLISSTVLVDCAYEILHSVWYRSEIVVATKGPDTITAIVM